MEAPAAYARQSVEKKGGLFIKGQLDLCRKAADSEILAAYRDRGFSGKNTDSPNFQRLLRDIKADKISKLDVYRLDRFSRPIADFGQLWNVLQEHNVEFVSVTENCFDESKPSRLQSKLIRCPTLANEKAAPPLFCAFCAKSWGNVKKDCAECRNKTYRNTCLLA